MDNDLQRTVEWHADRLGKFTASRFVDVMARNKKTGEPLKAWNDLVWQVVTERISKHPIESASSYAMQWGTDVEPYAREAYELDTGNVVKQSGFIVHPDFQFAGCSPDGLISTDGGLEMKCPKSPIIHLQRFIDGVPDEYIPQVQGCMWVTGRKWWDFVSYDPRQQPEFRLLRIRIERDEEYIARLQQNIIDAESAANNLVTKLSQKAA